MSMNSQLTNVVYSFYGHFDERERDSVTLNVTIINDFMESWS